MRIAVSTPTFLPLIGGAQLGIHEIYDRIGARHDVTILTPRLSREPAKGYATVEDYASERYAVRYLPPALDGPFPQLARGLRRTSLPYAAGLLRLSRESRFDLVNFHFAKPHAGAMLLARRVLKAPVALSLVGRSDVLRLQSRIERAYVKAAIASADAVIPNSAYYLGADAASTRAKVIPYGVDTDEFSPARRTRRLRARLGLGEERFVLFSVQRLARVKRVDQLILAMPQVVARDPRVVLVLAGKGEEERRLRKLVDELELGEHVRFLGYVEGARLPECFASSDAFVFHSMVETFGIVFAQAMSSGLPIVAADTSCVADVLGPENALLVRPFDQTAFADAILKLAADPRLSAEIGLRNRARAVRELDWRSIASRYESVFEGLVATRAVRLAANRRIANGGSSTR
jgi:glycosyltransferase involved in cell wall biosynthesis